MSEKITRDLVVLGQEIIKRKSEDPLLNWQPTPKQQPFIQSVLGRKARENWLFAANRSGKSDAGAYIGSYLARFGINGGPTTGWVSAVDFPTSRDTIQPKYFDNGFVPASQTHAPFIPDGEVDQWRASDQILKLKNGSIIGFKSADSGRKKYQGAERDWVHIDEEHPKEIYEEITIRIGGRPLRLFGTITLLPPEGSTGGVSWMYEGVITPWKRGTMKGVDLFGASIYDNPYLDKAEVEHLENIYPEGSVQRRIRLDGEWLPGIGGARAYPSFAETANVRAPTDLDPRLPLCWTWDFNVEPMVSLVGQVRSPSPGMAPSLFEVHREFVLDEGSIQDMVDLFRQHYPRHHAEVRLYGDATGRARTAQTNETNYTLIMNLMRSYPAPLKMLVGQINPPIISRLNAVNTACRSEHGQVNLVVNPESEELIADLNNVLLDPNGKIRKTTNRKDPYFRRTHISDALGYWVAYEAPVTPMRLNEDISRKPITRPGYGFGRLRH